MNDPFEKKVRAAAVAGWWVVLIAVAFLTLLWLVYLAVMSAHPAWLLSDHVHFGLSILNRWATGETSYIVLQ